MSNVQVAGSKNVVSTKSIKFDYAMDLKKEGAIDKAIKSLVNRRESLQKDIHALAVSILRHIILHGDHTAATSLVVAMNKSAIKANSLKKWFEAFSWLSWEKDGFIKDASKISDAGLTKELLTEMYNEAKANPFWTFKSAEDVDFDAVDFINKKVKQFESEYKKNHLSIEDLQALVTRLNGFIQTQEAVKVAVAQVESA